MSAASVTVLPRRTPPTLLVVEDDALTRCLISDELRGCGFKVLEASSAADALAILDATHVDLLFVDVHLAGRRSGLDVARSARHRPAPVLTILTSGKDDLAGLAELHQFGRFVRKPYLISHVLDLVTGSLNWPASPVEPRAKRGD